MADEGDSVTLKCELSKPGVPLEWRKGELGLCPCAKYEIRQKGLLATLVIHDVDLEDSGSYTCDVGDQRSTAQLAVKGMLPLAFYGGILVRILLKIISSILGLIL